PFCENSFHRTLSLSGLLVSLYSYLYLFVYIFDMGIDNIWNPPGYWQKHENRRQFLIDLAKSKGLDPFKADTWTKILKKDIIKARLIDSIIYIINKHMA